MQSLKPLPSAKVADASPKSVSAPLLTNKAASLAFLMSLDHTTATMRSKPTGNPTNGRTPAPPMAAVVASTSVAAKPAQPLAVPKLFKSIVSNTSIGDNSRQIHDQGASMSTTTAGQLQSSGYSASNTGATAPALVYATPPAQPSRVRQRSDDEPMSSVSLIAMQQPVSSASPRSGSVLSQDGKKRKTTR